MNVTKLGEALRQKYRNPRDVLRRLGLDEGLLGKPSGGDNNDATTALRIELEQLLSELDLNEIGIGKVLAVLDKHAPFDRLPDNDEHAELAGDQPEEYAAFADRLRSTGLAEPLVRKAVDMLPRPATNGGMGGRAADRRPTMGQDAAEVADFEQRFGGGHIVLGSPGMAHDEPPVRRPAPTNAEMADFNARFGGEHIS